MSELELSVEVNTKNMVAFLRFTRPVSCAEREYVEKVAADVQRDTGLTIMVLPEHLRPEAADGGIAALAERVAKLEALLGVAGTPDVLT